MFDNGFLFIDNLCYNEIVTIMRKVFNIKLFLVVVLGALALFPLLGLTISDWFNATFSGVTLPEKKVYLKMDDLPEKVSAPDESGNFEITISDLAEGKHQAKLWVFTHLDKIAKEINLPFSLSTSSPEKVFTNIDLVFEEMGNPDLNYDGRVDIVDFSIMLHFWTAE